MSISLPHRTHRWHALIFSCLMALLTTHLTAQVQIDYTNGQTNATTYDTSAPNAPLTLSILSGTATQSGVLFGSGRVLKVGAGTLILSGINTYSSDTVVHFGTLQVVTGASMSQSSANIFVADVSGDIGTLLVSGGTVGSNSGYIGTHAGSTGTVTVTAGTWTNSDTLYLGNEGTGVLNLSGGTVSDYSGLVGYASGSSGTANVSGGTWTNTGNIEVGYGGSGVLNLTGGSVTSSNGYLGSHAGSSGTVDVSGGSWAITDNLYIGHIATGVLTLSTGGSLSDTGATLGYTSGSSGTATVSGGTWTNSGDLNIGYDGTGVLNLTGGSVTAQVVYQGRNAGSSGTVNVGNGTLTNNTSYILGYSGSGVLNLSGGSISNAASSMAFEVGSSGTANVSGGIWTNNNGLVIGESGTGVLNLSGGSITADVVTQGLNAGSNGTVNVSNGTLTNNTSYFLGYSGSGVLNLSGGSISNASSSVGVEVGGSGTANVSGGTWTNNGSLVIGESGTGVLNLTAGSVSNTSADVGLNAGSSGTANVSGGIWAVAGLLEIGSSGTGVLNINGGSVTSNNGYMGSYDNGIGTTNVSSGSWNISNDLIVGLGFIGVMNLSGGSVTSTTASLAQMSDGHGTVNVSGGLWTVTSTDATYIGYRGTGVLNLTDSGTITLGPAGDGTLTLGAMFGSSGTLNLGTGGTAGTLNAASIFGGDGTAIVNFNHTGSYTFAPTLTGSLSVNQIGSGTTTLSAANTYTGSTSVLGGTLELGFGSVSTNILPTTTDLTLGSGTLLLGGEGTQTVNSLSTGISTSGRIVLGANETLDLGGLNSVGSFSALNFNTAAGGANGANVGTGIISLPGQTSGSSINPGFTVTDSTGFGLATVNADDQIIRLTSTALLPASGADSSTDYRIDNNAGDSTTAGSASLQVTTSETARSITVDTSTTAGTLTLASGVVLSTDVWNFGGNNSNSYSITGSDSGAGITTATAGGMLQINNYNTATLFISAPILDNGGSGLRVAGADISSTILSGASTYTGNTLVTSGALVVDLTGSISSVGTTTVGSQTGDHAQINILGTVNDFSAVLGDAAGASGTATVGGKGTWNNQSDLTVGNSGTGVLTILDGGYISSDHGYIGRNAGSSGTVTVNGYNGKWDIGSDLYIGTSGTGVLNIDNSLVTSSTGFLGVNAGSSGTVTVSNLGEWDVSSGLVIGQVGTGVLNLTNGGLAWVGGTVTLGAQGTLNIGTGGVAGYLNASTVTGVSGAVVNFNYNGLQKYFPPPPPVLTGDLAVNKLGSGYLFFDQQNTYTGGTTVNGGRLELDFGSVTTDIISSNSALTLGGGTLILHSQTTGSQTLNGLTTTAGTGSQIILGSNITLNLGSLSSAGQGSALNFDLYDGGAAGATVGSGIVLLSGQTAGSVINPGFTVTDTTGYGLATVNDLNQIIRLTNTDLLPDSGAVAGTDYLIDNNHGGNLDPGSNVLEITASQTARSITVDSSFNSGRLTLDSGVILSSDVWNFGGTHDYQITGSSSGAGITSATAGGMLQLNNFNYGGVVTISAPILDNGGSGLRVAGTDGLTVLTGADTYTGETLINSGTLFINGDHTAATGEIIVQSSGELAGIGQIGSNIHVLNGGMLTAGTISNIGTLTGTTATFDTNSIFHAVGGGDTLGTLHLTGAVTIAPGALIDIETDTGLTLSKYTLMTAASGLDGSTPFTVENSFGKPLKGNDAIPGYHLAYTGTELDLLSDLPAVAYWTGKVDSNWSSLTSGSTNWATALDGQTDTSAPPGTPTDVTFAAQTVIGGPTQANLDVDATIHSLTILRPTIIGSTSTHTLTVNATTTVSSELAINSGVTLTGKGAITIGTAGTLTGNGAVQMAADQNIIANGAIDVPAPPLFFLSPPTAEVLSLTTSGTGSIIMGADSSIHISINTGAGLGDNTAIGTAAGVLNLHGTLDATAGGTLVLENPNAMTAYAGGDQWKVVELNSGAGTITGHLSLNDSSLGLATGFIGSFDQTTGIYSIADHRPEMTAQSSGLPMANAEGQSIISGGQTATNDVNNHLFNLRSGGGEEDGPDGSITSSIDDGVIVGQGDGPESPVAKRVKRTRQWEVFTTVNYGNARLNPISNQSGVQIDSWASSVGIERHLSRGLTLGFAATFLQSTQTYTGGLGSLHLEGPSLSAYLSYVKKSFWSSLLYSFGDYDLGSSRNPGLGLPTASGATHSYTNAIQYNTGWNFRFQNNTLVTGPFAGIDYLHGTVDAYNETGGGTGALHYNKQTFQSLVTRVGWSASKKFETDWATITPQLRLSYERQNLRNNGTSVNLINAPFSANGGNQTPGQDYMVIGTGVNFQFTPDFSMNLGYQTQIFRNNMTAHFGSVRFGYKF